MQLEMQENDVSAAFSFQFTIHCFRFQKNFLLPLQFLKKIKFLSKDWGSETSFCDKVYMLQIKDEELYFFCRLKIYSLKMIIHFPLKCKKSDYREPHHFQLSTDSSNGQCLLTKHWMNEYSFMCSKCKIENSMDFDNVYNYCILKVVNDLYGV